MNTRIYSGLFFLATLASFANAQKADFPIPLPGGGGDQFPVPVCDILPEACNPGGDVDMQREIDQVSIEIGVGQSNEVLGIFDAGQSPPIDFVGSRFIIAEPERTYLGGGYVWIVRPGSDGKVPSVATAFGGNLDWDVVPICEVFSICETVPATTAYERSEFMKLDQTFDHWRGFLADNAEVLGVAVDGVSVANGLVAISSSASNMATFGTTE